MLNFRRTCPAIYRSGLCDVYSDAELKALRNEKRIRTWFDLRSDKERKNLPLFENHQIHYYNFPFTCDEALPTIPNTRDYLHYYERLVMGNGTILSPFFLTLLKELNRGACVISCFAGKDRTGIVCYLIHRMLETKAHIIRDDFILSSAALTSRQDIFASHAQKKQLSYEVYVERFTLCDDIFLAFDAWFNKTYPTIDYFLQTLSLPSDFILNFRNQIEMRRYD